MADPKRMRMRGYSRADQPYSAFTSEVRADLVGHGVSPGLADYLIAEDRRALLGHYRKGVPAEAVAPGLFVEACRMADEGHPLVAFYDATPPKALN